LNNNHADQEGVSGKHARTGQHGGRFQLRLRTALSVALALATLAGATDALACAACGHTLSTDFSTQGQSTQAGLSVDLSYSYIDQDTLRYGTGKASGAQINTLYNNGQEIETSTKTQILTPSFNYNSDTWGVSFQIPYLSRTHATDGSTNTPATQPLGSLYSTSSDSGIGDVRLIGRYSGFSSDRTSGLIAGIKLPTGNTSATFSGGAAAGQPLDPSLQIGTGSTDVILGGYTSGLIGRYGWFIQGTVQRAVSAPETIAGVTFRPGQAILLNSGIRYAGFGAKVVPMLQLDIVHRQPDEGTSVPNDVLTGVPVSGGTLVYLAPGAVVRLGGGASVYGFIQLPVYQNVNSLQLTPRYIFTLGVRQAF
jgi:hypothetical protein